jgi:hypothetical protein
MADDDIPTLDAVPVNLRYPTSDYVQQKFKTVLADIDQKAKVWELSLTNKAMMHAMSPSVAKEKRKLAVSLRLSAIPVSILRNAVTKTRHGATPAPTNDDEKPILISGGCQKAQALVAILFGEFDGKRRRTAAAILAIDGEKAIMEQIPA